MTPRVTVVGLGPAGPDLLTAATQGAIDASSVRFVRTIHHPAAALLADARSFDRLYESAETIEEVYPAIVEELVAAAEAHGEVLYAVPGSPAVAERSVELLRADARVQTTVLPALSCVDLVWARLGVDPLARGARIVDGHRFRTEAAGERGPLLVLQCDRTTVLSDIKLSAEGDHATLLHHLGLPDERIETVAWHELDRIGAQPDHLTSVWVPSLHAPVGYELARLGELVRTLRARCPWDQAQTHVSLRPYVLEEAYEVADAIDSETSEHLEEELGDLLFQVYIHATLAEEDGEFDLADVARGIHDKLVRRHPHVFGGEPVAWDDLKQQEKPRDGVFDGLPNALPALAFAEQAQKRAAKAGFDWPDVEGPWAKVAEEIAEVRAAGAEELAGEIGDLLFACVNVARHLGADPEDALREATRRFRRRFEEVERRAAARGVALADADPIWEEVKRDERGAG
ncbi:MAG: nucleoside triphosphate pyrophosphohydrolase [Acidimicrobiales bacterium]